MGGGAIGLRPLAKRRLRHLVKELPRHFDAPAADAGAFEVFLPGPSGIGGGVHVEDYSDGVSCDPQAMGGMRESDDE